MGDLLVPGSTLISIKLWVSLETGLPGPYAQHSLGFTNTFSVSLPALGEAKMRTREEASKKGVVPGGQMLFSRYVTATRL